MKTRHAHRTLSLPTGTETLHLVHTERHRRISRRLAAFYEAWGYRPVETPLVDFFEVFRPLLNEDDVRVMYRAVDRQGEILALRSDTTIFLAKQLGVHLREDELPVRVYYDEQIVRAEEEHDIARNEFQQAGVEIVGVPGTEGDAEAMILALESLAAVGVDGGVLHVGSRAVIDALFETADAATVRRAHAAIRRRRFSDAVIASLPETVRRLLTFIGTPGDFRLLVDEIRGDLSETAYASIKTVERSIARVHEITGGEFEDALRIDLSEVGSHGYYTGIAFAVYLPTANTAVIRGGRYDRLLNSFGFDAPSVGFSMFTSKLPVDAEAPSNTATGGTAPSLEQRFARGRRQRDGAVTSEGSHR